MPVFKVKARDGSITLLVRARCISCARDVAAEAAGPEGSRLWRDPERSGVELVQHPESMGLEPQGPRSVLKREMRDG